MLDGVTTAVNRDVPWARLDVRHQAARRVCRRIYRVTALSAPLAFGVHNNNLVNFLRGVRERVFAVQRGTELVMPPRPHPGAFERELSTEARTLDRMASSTTPYTYDQFVDTYAGRRRTVYQMAVDSLVARAVNRRDAQSRSFLKAEKIAFYLKDDPAPRLIHPRDPRYNVEVGRFVKRIEHNVYHHIDEMWGDRTVLKGYNAGQVAGILSRKWQSFKRPVAIGLDASRFDQHVSVEALKWEHERYLAHFNGHDREVLRELLSWQLQTKCVGRCDDATIRYTVDGMRFSGDMNTGLGNCLLMSSMVHAWCRIRGVKAQLGNNGDDCVLILEAGQVTALDLQGMCAWFESLGFTMKVEPTVDVFERIEFCQCSPVWAGDRYVMVRKHGHAMAKDCISLKPLNSRKLFDRWRNSIGLCGISLTGGVPVQQSFYCAMRRGAGDGKLDDPTMETGFARMARGMSREVQAITAESRLSYWLAFGVSPDEQVALEKWFERRHLEYSFTQAEGTNACPLELSL